MGKLATTGRLVTRDNEEEQKASVWLLLERSGASSDRALVAVPIIGGIGIQLATGEEEEEEEGERVRVTRAEAATIEASTFGSVAASRFVDDARRGAGDGERTANVSGVEVRRSETAGEDFGDTVVCLDGHPSPIFPLDRRRCFDPDAQEKRNGACGFERTVPRGWSGGGGEGGGSTIVETRERRGSRGCWRRRRRKVGRFAGSEQLSLLLGIARIAAVAAVLCAATASAVPMLSRENPLSRTGPRYDLDRSAGLEDVYEDAFEDAFREEDPATTRSVLDETELDVIRRSIARGLGLERIPDPTKANVSQAEYERAHREYLMRTQLSFDQRTSGSKKNLHVFPATEYPGNETSRSSEGSERTRDYRHWLFFPVEIPQEDDDTMVDHATLRLLLHSPSSDDQIEDSELDVLLYLRTFDRSRKLIGRRRIESQDWRNSRWLEFEATAAVSSWLGESLENLGLELEFLIEEQPVRRAFSSPVLNVFTSTSPRVNSARTKRSSPEELMSLHKGRRTKCKGESKKCCRHELTVMFKDLKGFEFIVYPKTFDAGFCKGRCPPRYNPAHHHALLQSLLWKEDRKKVPKPCCAPSKLDQLMIVYFDENDSTQLKVSYWKNIQVLECACS